MRTLILACLVFAACKNKEQPKPAPEPVASGSPPAPAPVASGSARAPLGDYDSHMKAGADLEDQKKWVEALAEFETALKLKPDDARALSEIGFTAVFAGKLDRAKQASTAAVLAAKDDAKLRGSALFNLGLAVEKEMPHAAAQLYIASLTARPSPAVRARLAKLQKDKAASKPTPEGDALLAKVGVKPGKAPAAPKSNAKPIDQQLISALEGAGVEWESGAGKSVLLVKDLTCRQSNQTKPATYECERPAVKGKQAKAIIDNLIARKLEPVKEHGDVVTYTAASVRCRALNEGDSGAPDECEVTK